MNDKMRSMIGFAIKAGKVVFGEDNIKKDRKVKLIICCKSVDESKYLSLKEINKTAIILDCILSDIIYKNAKIIGITDRQMAEQIKKLSKTT